MRIEDNRNVLFGEAVGEERLAINADELQRLASALDVVDRLRDVLRKEYAQRLPELRHEGVAGDAADVDDDFRLGRASTALFEIIETMTGGGIPLPTRTTGGS